MLFFYAKKLLEVHLSFQDNRLIIKEHICMFSNAG